MRVAAMLRVRNEARWINLVLDSIKPLCSSIHVMDDHSTDGTAEIASQCGATVHPSPFDGLNETRDKNWLLDIAMQDKPDWILCIDGDEILEAGCRNELLTVMSSGDVSVLSFRVLYLWDAWTQYRVDGVYSRFWRPSLFRAVPGAKFKTTGNGGNFHCGNIPQISGRQLRVSANLIHTGYMDREDRIRKYHWYNEQDPGNRVEDCYRHMVQGDIPEVPATARLIHAGPLKLEAIQWQAS